MELVLVILAVAALIAVVVSFVPSFEILHKVATILLAICLVVYFLTGAV